MEYFLNLNQSDDPSFLSQLVDEKESTKEQPTEVIQNINQLLGLSAGISILVVTSLYFLFIFMSIYCKHD